MSQLKIILIAPFLIVCFSLKSLVCVAQDTESVTFDFFGEPVEFLFDKSTSPDFLEPLTSAAIHSFYKKVSEINNASVLNALIAYKQKNKPDDWLYYQLIRKTAQAISPKADNYNRYTLYKWFLMTKSGYDATLAIAGNHLFFYVQSNETIYNIPYRQRDGKQYVCLNYHDFGKIDLENTHFSDVAINIHGAQNAFSYKITRLPDFKTGNYSEKELQFSYNQHQYHFKIRLNQQVKNIFINYPATDYELHFNMPVSAETYGSLIPALKESVKGINQKNGVDFLMHFTRYAFSFKPDAEIFGQEKRLSPEQTLLYEYSDCEDRAALFFYLVKEIYNLPMIVLTYPKHVTVAVQFEKGYGKTIAYNGNKYSVCEPSSQKIDLQIGQILPELSKVPYEVAYVYRPEK